ncbi:MAG: DUF6797 domain-containing protein [Limisphaerales bacterium]
MIHRIRVCLVAALLCAALPLPAQEAQPVLHVLNGSQQTLDVFWLKSDAERVANGSVPPGKDTTVTTTLGHRFALVGREDRTEFTVTSEVPVQAVRFDPPSRDGVPAFYTQAVSAEGFPIVASAKVNPYALKEAAFLVNRMLERRPDVRRALIRSGARMGLLAHDEFTTDLPEFAHLGEETTPDMGGLGAKTFWDARARGTGGSKNDPFCTSAEENVLGFPGDPYATECILIHEFAHCIHLRGMVNVDPTFDARLQETYGRAMKAGLWKGKNASVNHHEYFAEGVQSWFDNNRVNDHDHNHVNTRALLLEYDPGLAAMCREVFGDTVLVYTKPATRLTGHLAGYNPEKAPTFVWPQRLAKAKAEIRAHAQERNQEANSKLDARPSPPKDPARVETENEDRSRPQYQRMNFGPALFWTYEIAPGNIAQKGIAVRLDKGAGGVSKGRAWMVYDHDTMRVATATTGDFVDWKGIGFDGSHGTHTGLTGDRQFINPVGPGWASPEGSWEDPRPAGRDQRLYGALPREWAHYEGTYLHGGQAVIAARIGGTRVLELPGWIDAGETPVFTRTLNVGKSAKPLQLRVAPDSVNVALVGDGSLRRDGGFWIAKLPGDAKTRLFISRAETAALAALTRTFNTPLDLEPLTHGGPPRWAGEVVTTSVAGKADGAFIADTFPLPIENPWQSWMRPGGFDFTPDGQAALVATWNGDVWRVDGLLAAAPAPLRWRRIASGLFQPLGVKFRGDDVFITCRDQLVRLRDLNGDGEADYIESFNSDHQVTEHFHEFAMGLQTDAAGNFYYAKSARHALPALVPHHGTLLRVSADGLRTDIVANGFRAANGVCVNDDGTFFVTDQEGHWTPKNRINRVKTGGFYGNLFGYTSVTNTSDAAMEQPMVWITNAKDRSPGELLWVPKDAWGSLGGSLLNLSYGTGRAFIVPHEEVDGQWQGAVCELPLPAFPTGIMRGRFAADGALYTCGLFSWAGNATAPGGFHRIRRSDKPADVPLALHAAKGSFSVTFSDPLDPASVKPDAFSMKVWTLKRAVTYGSNHYGEHPLEITGARLGADARTVTVDIPSLTPTQCYELKLTLLTPDGTSFNRSLHGTIHQLADR